MPRAKGQVREALAYVRARPEPVMPMVLIFFVATFGMNFQVTTALMSREVFHTGAGAFGIASAVFAARGAGRCPARRPRRSRPGLRLLVTAVRFGVLEMTTALMPDVLRRSSCCWCRPAWRC